MKGYPGKCLVRFSTSLEAERVKWSIHGMKSNSRIWATIGPKVLRPTAFCSKKNWEYYYSPLDETLARHKVIPSFPNCSPVPIITPGNSFCTQRISH